ncbi:DNA (cytosine-5-)-methyltransferase [Roseibium sp. RKSG952]|nr:DNA (cytosine-5-)-methyltransferase [Roseibium sp. RKSG952]
MRTIDLFCGCGGLSLGLQQAGFDVVAGADACEKTMRVYKVNNTGHAGLTEDLSDQKRALEITKSFAPDVIAGGPPCQDYSSAGNRKEGDRAALTIGFTKLVCDVRPKLFIMENVARAEKSKTFKRAFDLFRAAGYGLTTRVLDASLCGVPQKRQRLFVVGAVGNSQGWLDPFIDARLSDEPMTVREYMNDEIGVEHYYLHPRHYGRRAVFSIDEPAPTIRSVHREPPPTYVAHPQDFVDPSSHYVRGLSTYERSRVQTFPMEFIWPKNATKAFLDHMIGNAVPVELAEFVGSCILEAIGTSERERGRRKPARLVPVDGKALKAA